MLLRIAIACLMAGAAAVFAFFVILLSSPVKPPERPSQVPENAVLGGCPDGCQWLVCRAGSSAGRWYCTLFAEMGSVSVQGEFVASPKNARWEDFEYSSADSIMYLQNDGTLSLDGVGEFPSIGITQRFSMGVEIGPKEELRPEGIDD